MKRKEFLSLLALPFVAKTVEKKEEIILLHSNGNIGIGTRNYSPELMRVRSNGSITLGTINPSHKLTVEK